MPQGRKGPGGSPARPLATVLVHILGENALLGCFCTPGASHGRAFPQDMDENAKREAFRA